MMAPGLSPNCGARRDGLTPTLVVLHYTAMATAEAAVERLCDPAAEVSAHYLITRTGEVVPLVPEDLRAWHAGAGEWQGLRDINSRSIGIELDNDGAAPFGSRQMDALEALLAGVMARWDIPPSGVIGHSDMAPDRKSDPGPRFDWLRLERADEVVAANAGLELAFGVLLGLCAIRRAPVGTFFYRLMGTTALVPLIAAALLPPLFGGAAWTDPGIVAALLACLAFPVYSGPIKRSRRSAGLVFATVCSGAALAWTAWQLPGIEAPLGGVLASLSAMATGAVAGGVGLAMVLGHWYLTVPELPVSWLRRLNGWTAIAMVVSGATSPLPSLGIDPPTSTVGAFVSTLKTSLLVTTGTGCPSASVR